MTTGGIQRCPPVGGALEYLSLLTGFRALGLIALGLYALAWLFANRLQLLGDRRAGLAEAR
jgi:hypothetical protein